MNRDEAKVRMNNLNQRLRQGEVFEGDLAAEYKECEKTLHAKAASPPPFATRRVDDDDE